jgi:carbamate kinase
VNVRYGKPDQKALGAVTLEEIESLQQEGHFAKGGIEPKAEAIVNFLKAGGKRGLITSPARLVDAMDGRADTQFVGKI